MPPRGKWCCSMRAQTTLFTLFIVTKLHIFIHFQHSKPAVVEQVFHSPVWTNAYATPGYSLGFSKYQRTYPGLQKWNSYADRARPAVLLAPQALLLVIDWHYVIVFSFGSKNSSLAWHKDLIVVRNSPCLVPNCLLFLWVPCSASRCRWSSHSIPCDSLGLFPGHSPLNIPCFWGYCVAEWAERPPDGHSTLTIGILSLARGHPQQQ